MTETHAYPQMHVLEAHHPHAPAFSQPFHTDTDAALLQEMLADLRRVVRGQASPGEHHRLLVFDPARLVAEAPLAFVGFRGERRQEIDPLVESAVDRIDAALVSGMAQVPGVLSYGCQRLPDGNWINLVVLGDLSAISAWHRSALHREASVDLSPRYYASVRLHNGLLPDGIAGPLRVLDTKYYDFSAEQPWLARRQFSAV